MAAERLPRAAPRLVSAPAAPGGPQPRWDGRRVLFEVLDGDRPVACAISVNALQDISAIRRSKPADLLQCFAQARGRIEAAALTKHRRRPAGASGLLHLWSDDFEEPPPGQGSAKALRTG